MSYGSTPPPIPPTDSAAPPPNYLVWAILATVLCFWPMGIAAIVFSTQVNSKWAAGDVEGAQAASKKAKTWSIATAITGPVLGVIYAIFVLVVLRSNS